jgi:hypothetical protein
MKITVNLPDEYFDPRDADTEKWATLAVQHAIREFTGTAKFPLRASQQHLLGRAVVYPVES